ncbi:hypothetical protein ACFL59_07490 [Planctomycetota bacterium]
MTTTLAFKEPNDLRCELPAPRPHSRGVGWSPLRNQTRIGRPIRVGALIAELMDRNFDKLGIGGRR